MNEAVKGYIACDNLKISPDNTVTVSGQVTNSLYDIPTEKMGLAYGSCARSANLRVREVAR